MEPQIQYVRSVDGTRIAVSTLGEGQPLVLVAMHRLDSIEVHWQIPAVRANLERLAQKRMLVQYDARGIGLSQREVSDFSLNARVHDLEAVVDRLGAQRVDLIASSSAGPTAIAYAARRTEGTAHLVLESTTVRGEGRMPAKRWALTSLVAVDWKMFVQSLMLYDYGWTDLGRQVAETAVNIMTPEVLVTAFREERGFDIAELLSEIRCPTLVVHRRVPEEEGGPIELSKALAASLPNARFVSIGAPHYFLLASDWEAGGLATIEHFLDESEALSQRDLPSGTAIILFADIVDSTALTERLGDAAFREKARELDGALRAIIRENAGTPIEGKLLGDGVLAVFTSARQAIEAALACGKAGDDGGLPLHLGLHAGDVIREADADGRANVYGGAVNIASRISGLSAPGEVLVSETVRSLARTSAGVEFEDRGEQALKGVGEAVRVWAVVEGSG